MARDADSKAEYGPHSIEGFPFFFGNGLFGVLHAPSQSSGSCWVICNPFGMEYTNSHRLNFEWARALAGEGHWVLRFDYRGTGDSAGIFAETTIHDYLEDIGQAVSEVERISGVACRGLVGLRLGADLAATFAKQARSDFDLVMWEPMIDGRKYRKSLLRTAMANEMVNSGGRHRSRREIRRELEAGRSVSVDGFALTEPMYDSLAAIDLEAQGRPTSAPVFLAQINSRLGRAPRSVYADLVNAYSSYGAVRFETVQAPSMWLRTKSYRWRQRELFSATIDWIGESQPRSSDDSMPVVLNPGGITFAGSIERPVGFDVKDEKVWGILHEPEDPRENAPNIVMLAAGVLSRSGIFYTRLARDLAAAGWRVLRFDPRGMGDSEGLYDCDSVDEVYSKIDKGALVPDTLAALDFLSRECGIESAVLTGLCGGAATSIRTAAVDDRVIGVAPLELPLKLAPSPVPADQIAPTGRDLWIDQTSRRRGTGFLLAAYGIARTANSNARRLKMCLSKILNARPGSSNRNERWFREHIGEDANTTMLAALQGILAEMLPVFCIYSDSRDAQLFELALPGLIGAEGKDPVPLQHVVIPGKDHVFTMPGQADELSCSLRAWLDSEPWARERRERPADEGEIDSVT